MSPAPTRLHQRAALAVLALLSSACPADHEVLVAPLDWQPDSNTSLQPDVLVLDNRDLDANVGDSMILAVEILSPSTRRKDLILKRSKYQDSGVQNYWIVDPAVPSILALHWVDGKYVTVGEASGNDVITVEEPFAVTVVPASLIS